MKTIIWVLAGLLIWNGILTGCLLAYREQVIVAQFGVSFANQEIGRFKIELADEDSKLVRTQKSLARLQAREQIVEEDLVKIVHAITQPDPAPSRFNRNRS
jgi:hypothetical protein